MVGPEDQDATGPTASRPHPGASRVSAVRAAAGRQLLRPWIDRLALKGINQWYLPLSRAWASAIDSQGSYEAFLAGIAPARASESAARRLIDRVERKCKDYLTATAAWDEAFFGPRDPGGTALEAAERRRLAAAETLMLARRHFLPMHLKRRLPPVKWELSDPEQVADRHRDRLRNLDAAFPPMTEVLPDTSRVVAGSHGAVSWLRQRSSLGDFARARVISPPDADDPPTFIYLHGVTIEAEMWRDNADPVAALARSGVRVIRAEAPWHGRRRLPGYYSGEPVLGRGPMGLLDIFAAWVAETSAWLAWARRSSRGPVAIGGISLGALTSQIVLTAARGWPAAQRPDAALVVAGSGDILATGYDGALPRALGLHRQLADHGWTREAVAHWRPLLEPSGPPAVAPDRILMLLGSADEITPFETGQRLARDWGVPDGNLMVRNQGHFTLDLGLLVDPSPLHALAALLKGL